MISSPGLNNLGTEYEGECSKAFWIPAAVPFGSVVSSVGSMAVTAWIETR